MSDCEMEARSSDGSDSAGSLRHFVVDEGETTDEYSAHESDDEADEEAMDGSVTLANLALEKRVSRPPQRYEDENYRQLMLDDCDSELSEHPSEASDHANDDSDESYREHASEESETDTTDELVDAPASIMRMFSRVLSDMIWENRPAPQIGACNISIVTIQYTFH